MNREPIRSPARSVANLEFHHTGDHVNEVARKIVATLERQGVRAVNPAMGFPMEMDRFPGGKIWVVSHKPVAVAAGLGHMGIHRNVIHPKFGNFILLGTILIAAEATAYNQPLVQPLPGVQIVRGGVSRGGDLPGRATSTSRPAIPITTGSSWAASPIGLNKSPTAKMPWTIAGVTIPNQRRCGKAFPLGPTTKPRTAWRLPGWRGCHRPLSHRQSRASEGRRSSVAGEGRDDLRRSWFRRRRPCRPPLSHKTIKRVGNGLRPRTIQRFLSGLPLTFQPGTEGLNAVYHFTFTGKEEKQATVTIRAAACSRGRPSRRGRSACDRRQRDMARLPGERAELALGLAPKEIRIKGSPKLLVAFGKCFPS